MMRSMVVIFVAGLLCSAKAFPQEPAPPVIPDLNSLTPSSVSSLVQLFTGLAANQIKSTPIESLAQTLELAAENGINSVTDEQLKAVTNVAKENAKNAVELLADNPALFQEGQELVAQGIESVGKFVAQNPELLERTLKLLQENEELQKLLVSAVTSLLPLLQIGIPGTS